MRRSSWRLTSALIGSGAGSLDAGGVVGFSLIARPYHGLKSATSSYRLVVSSGLSALPRRTFVVPNDFDRSILLISIFGLDRLRSGIFGRLRRGGFCGHRRTITRFEERHVILQARRKQRLIRPSSSYLCGYRRSQWAAPADRHPRHRSAPEWGPWTVAALWISRSSRDHITEWRASRHHIGPSCAAACGAYFSPEAAQRNGRPYSSITRGSVTSVAGRLSALPRRGFVVTHDFDGPLLLAINLGLDRLRGGVLGRWRRCAFFAHRGAIPRFEERHVILQARRKQRLIRPSSSCLCGHRRFRLAGPADQHLRPR